LVLLVGPQNSPTIGSVRELAEGLGLAIATMVTPVIETALRHVVLPCSGDASRG
jgi:hypothetical protein